MVRYLGGLVVLDLILFIILIVCICLAKNSAQCSKREEEEKDDEGIKRRGLLDTSKWEWSFDGDEQKGGLRR